MIAMEGYGRGEASNGDISLIEVSNLNVLSVHFILLNRSLRRRIFSGQLFLDLILIFKSLFK